MKKNILLTVLAFLVLTTTSLSSFLLYSAIDSKAAPIQLLNQFTYGVAFEQHDVSSTNAKLIAGPWLMENNQNVVYDFLGKFKQPQNQNKVPYIYMYIAAGSARQDWGLQDCNVGAREDQTLCHSGANYLRSNYKKVTEQYKQYATGIKEAFGSDRPILLHVEPDFYQYNYSSQYGGGISFDEAARAMNSWTDTIRQILPKASLVLDVSPWNSDLAGWSSGMRNFDYAGLVGKRFSPTGDGTVENGIDGKKYSEISKQTGKKVILNDSHGPGGWYLGYDYKWHEQYLIEERWKDGIVALIQPPSDLGALAWAVNNYEQNPVPAGSPKPAPKPTIISSSSSSSSSLEKPRSSSSSSSSSRVQSVSSKKSSSSSSSSSVIIKKPVSADTNIGGINGQSKVVNENISVCNQNDSEFAIKKGSAWNSGYTASLTIKNKSNKPLTDWQVNLNLPSSQKLNNSWNVQPSKSTGNVSLKPVADWNRVIQPNQEYEVGGFMPETNGDNVIPEFNCNSSR
jgi:hypothetical protein